MVESIETVIIGAGHAGLSTSYCLKQQGREHTILDMADKPGNAWRKRWDSFTFVSPNWTFLLPGGEYDGPEPDGFMTRDELVNRFDNYIEKYQLPITFNTCVESIEPQEDRGYLVKTQAKDYRVHNVIVANGFFGTGQIPPFASKIPPSILQIHSSSYCNPQSLSPGAVLVVGTGQSGAQMAEELYQSGRKVFLATGTAPHAPRRYRGKDIFRWIYASGFADRTFAQMQLFGKSFVGPMISGKNGGHALNLHKFYREGVILLGHARDYVDGKLILAGDLKENLTKADTAQKFILKFMDDYIQRSGIEAPPSDLPEMTDAYQAADITTLDLQSEGVNTIIWASGYRYDPSIFQFPVLDQFGIPDAPQGASSTHPGIYFLGFPFVPTLSSGFLAGVARSASYVTEQIQERAAIH